MHTPPARPSTSGSTTTGSRSTFATTAQVAPTPLEEPGLTGLLDRVEASAGTLTITSPPELGTTLHATLLVGDLSEDRRFSR